MILCRIGLHKYVEELIYWNAEDSLVQRRCVRCGKKVPEDLGEIGDVINRLKADQTKRGS